MLNELCTRYPSLEICREDVQNAMDALIAMYEQKGKLLICGNGGSCADSDHIVGELMKGFLKKRPLSPTAKAKMQQNCPGISDDTLHKLQCGLPAISLPGITALGSAFCNDVDPALTYAQGVLALAGEGDIVLCLSTSGNAENVFCAAQVAKGLGLKVIGMTGKHGGKLKTIADICICVPETETFKVQELHLPVYHCLCAAVEAHFFCE